MISGFTKKLEEAAAMIDIIDRNLFPDSNERSEINSKVLKYAENYGSENPDVDHSDKIDNAVYLIKYSRTYAFEYYLLYRVLLQDSIKVGNNRIGVTSFGCGSCIDAWSLAYAVKELNANNLTISYTGTDIVNWPIKFLPEDLAMDTTSIGDIIPDFSCPGMAGNNECDIVDYFCNSWDPSNNVLLFPKILNILPEDTIDNMISAITDKVRKNGLAPDIPYYLCISFSSCNDINKNSINERLIQSLNINNEYKLEIPQGDIKFDKYKGTLALDHSNNRSIYEQFFWYCQQYSTQRVPLSAISDSYSSNRINQATDVFKRSNKDIMKNINRYINFHIFKLTPNTGTNP